MKILYGITKSNFGGAQRYVFDLATEAKKAGHDVAVLCGGEGTLVQKLKAEGIRIISIPGFGRDMDLLHDASRLWFIVKTVWEEKPDVFHINSAKMGGAGIFSGRIAGVKNIVFTSHGWAFNESRPAWQKILIKFFSWMTIICAHKTICVSDKTKQQIAHWPFIKNKLVVIKNGIAGFNLLPRDEARKALGVHDDTLIVGTLSELHPIKGLDILLEAWGKFSHKHTGKLIILGDGEIRKNLEDQANYLGIADKVVFKGYVDNARKYLNAFDIFCLPSRSENLPYSLLEAGFAARPTIATEVGGIPEVINGGISGALVPAEDSETLFSTMVLLSQDTELRERLGHALKETISKEFSLEKMVKETLSLYTK